MKANQRDDAMIGRVCLWRRGKYVIHKWARPQGRHVTNALLVPADTPDDLSQKKWVNVNDLKLTDERIAVSRLGDRTAPLPDNICPVCRHCKIDRDTYVTISGQRVACCDACWAEPFDRKARRSAYSSRRWRGST